MIVRGHERFRFAFSLTSCPDPCYLCKWHLPPPLTLFLQDPPAFVLPPHKLDAVPAVLVPDFSALVCPPCCQHFSPVLLTLRLHSVPAYVFVAQVCDVAVNAANMQRIKSNVFIKRKLKCEMIDLVLIPGCIWI